MYRAERRRQQKAKKSPNVPLPITHGNEKGMAAQQYVSLQQMEQTAIGHYDAGRIGKTKSLCRTILNTDPKNASALNLLGNIMLKAGKSKEAIAFYKKAIASDPDYAVAHYNLGVVLKNINKGDEAFLSHCRAIILDQKKDAFWSGLYNCIVGMSFKTVDDNLWNILLPLVLRPWANPRLIYRPVMSAVRLHEVLASILEQDDLESFVAQNGFNDTACKLSTIPLFLHMLTLYPIRALDIERLLTVLRRAMIKEVLSSELDAGGKHFWVALSLQCFANEYVWAESEEEQVLLEQLEAKISTLLDKKQQIPESFIAALACYKPLYTFPWASELSAYEYSPNIKSVIEQQVVQPKTEVEQRLTIPNLTPIEGVVSQSVREQYENNPYPRWVKTGLVKQGQSVASVVGGQLKKVDLANYTSPERPEILVAGCGTGQHSLSVVSNFANAQVLAVDLSLSSLAYAIRKTKEYGLSNIEYAQADITKLDSLGRTFDIIECAGVLHHMADPMQGWQVLTDLLKPGGLMKIGLYSETARADVIAARQMIEDQGFTSSASDIRQCREVIKKLVDDGNPLMQSLSVRSDFFSLSECRDLIFHVQEHRFTIPQIEKSLENLNLKFLGFTFSASHKLAQAGEAASRKHMAMSLADWHKFEQKNPNTFRGMYQFWCQKK